MTTRVVVFGAFDRHNLGDLLFAHVAEALFVDCECVFAGLFARDLRDCGGHHVRAIADLLREAAGRNEAPMPLLHAGGEILDCDAWQAAVMLLDADEAAHIVARLHAKPHERDAWARRLLANALHVPDAQVPHAPYVVSHASLPGVARTAFAGVGGVGLSLREAAMRDEVLAALRSAAAVSVRDRTTWETLRAHAIDAALVPDPAVMVAALFGQRILTRVTVSSDLARVRDAFPDGWLAIQFSADFGDDATLSTIATQLDEVARDTRLGLVLFRTGAAPWHDALEVLERLAARLHAPSHVFRSLDAWDISALIAQSRGFCGSSLHGRIVAGAFGRARINVAHPSVRADATKQHSYAATWESETQPGVVVVQALGDGLRAALARDRGAREREAWALAARFRGEFDAIRSALVPT
jgi:hypothetical protein